jgi:hypothetical protein
MDPKNPPGEPGSGSGTAPVMQGSRSIIFALVMSLVWLTVFPGAGQAGDREWTSHFYDDALGSNAAYQEVNSDRTRLSGLTVYRDRVYVKTWPHTWTDLISLEVAGTSFRKMYAAGERDCHRILNNIVFVVTGDSAQELIRALAQGASITIKDCGGKGEPRFDFPLQGFNAAYERAMRGRD